jgi:hypothetical protein
MELINKYKSYVKSSGGISRARKNSNLWLKNTLADSNNESIESIQRGNLLKPGKIYTFNYSAKTYLDPLPYYDTNPMILSLGVNTSVKPLIEYGININYLPNEIKEKFLDSVYTAYKSSINENIKGLNSQRADKQKELSITYKMIKPLVDKYYLGFAIKNYIPERKTNVKVISYENWHHALLLETASFIGASKTKVRFDYIKYIKNKSKR